MMQLGAETVFVGSGIFKSEDPPPRPGHRRGHDHYDDPDVLARVSEELGEAMPGLDVRTMPEEELLQTRGV
jgi:pyridoxal 5'-phosphate synthase pdxS subunit